MTIGWSGHNPPDICCVCRWCSPSKVVTCHPAVQSLWPWFLCLHVLRAAFRIFFFFNSIPTSFLLWYRGTRLSDPGSSCGLRSRLAKDIALKISSLGHCSEADANSSLFLVTSMATLSLWWNNMDLVKHFQVSSRWAKALSYQCHVGLKVKDVQLCDGPFCWKCVWYSAVRFYFIWLNLVKMNLYVGMLLDLQKGKSEAHLQRYTGSLCIPITQFTHGLLLLSHLVMSDSVTPWTIAPQTPLSMGFSRQEYWSGLLFSSPSPMDSISYNHGTFVKPETLALVHDS